MPLSVNLSSPSVPGRTEEGRYPVFFLTEPWTLFHRRVPLSLPLSSALLSHPQTDHLRQWDESRRRSETKRELPDKRGPASALVPLKGAGGGSAAHWPPALSVSQWSVAFTEHGNARWFYSEVKEYSLIGSWVARKTQSFIINGFF